MTLDHDFFLVPLGDIWISNQRRDSKWPGPPYPLSQGLIIGLPASKLRVDVDIEDASFECRDVRAMEVRRPEMLHGLRLYAGGLGWGLCLGVRWEDRHHRSKLLGEHQGILRMINHVLR